MSLRSDQKAAVSLFTLVIVFFALLPRVAHAQTRASEEGGYSSSLLLFGASRVETNAPASASPAMLALDDVAGTEGAVGGLWLTGDTEDGFRYLHWIAGNQPAGLLTLDTEGKVSFNLKLLSKAASLTSDNAANQRETITSFVRSDEGLRLLAEMTNGPHRFRLHVGGVLPTRAGDIRNDGARNIDNRFDSRLNPRRPNGQKADCERPPEGIDSLIAVNPDVCWFNLCYKRLVPRAQIVFHELAEAHARLAHGLDYLAQGDKTGAHDVAVEREIQLKQQRPWQFVIRQIGENIVLISRDDWLRLFDTLREQKRSGPFRIYE